MNNLLLGRRVLVVEDEPLVAILVEEVMDRAGATALVVRDVPQALKALAEGEFDVAVVDINLRGQQSWPVTDALAERGLPFVLATGNADMADARLGSARVVAKPYSANQLIQAVADALADGAAA